MGIISNHTIRANHPWVSSVEDEEKWIEKERKAEMVQYPELTGSEEGEEGEEGVIDDETG
ncbi:hypothetical protein D3C73_1352850 [compost metagenome]